MSTKKSTAFYGVLIGLTCMVVGMVIASRLDLTPGSFAGSINVPATNSAPLDGALDAGTFRRIAEVSGPAVVSIRTEASRRRQSGGSLRELFPGFRVPDEFGGDDPGEELLSGAGSGFIVDKAGYVLTNRHVINGADRIEVFLHDMDTTLGPTVRGLAAEVVGQDELTDTALLRITDTPAKPLTEVKFGDSGQLAPGDWVMAIGNPFSYANTVTVGVVSAIGREEQLAAPSRYEALIQTDAAINRGNSGGPLLNVRGEVVGVNTMILTNPAAGGGNLGIGFAVPINTVRDILPGLRSGKVVRGRIGVSVDRQPMTEALAQSYGLPRVGGVVVSRVDPGPAADAGIRVDDVLVEFNGEALENSNQLVDRVMRTAPGTNVPVTLYRGGRRMTVNVRVGELDLEAEQAVAVNDANRPEQPNRREPIETGFGLTIEELSPNVLRQLGLPASTSGAVITGADPRGIAARSGLGRGDVIVRVNGQATASLDAVDAALSGIPSGGVARIVVLRQGRELLFNVVKP